MISLNILSERATLYKGGKFALKARRDFKAQCDSFARMFPYGIIY